MSPMKWVRAIIIWLNPQQGVIDALKLQIKGQEALIQTLRCQVKSERIENEKLWEELKKLRA